MHFIHITEFLGWEYEDILEYLKIHNEEKYEISIPKSTKLFFSSSEDIAIEYLIAAYVGQRLSAITDKFDYNEIPPQDHVSISYFVENVDPEKLSEVLYDIAIGFGGGDDSFNFHEDVNSFLDDVEENKIAPACSFFLEIYEENKVDEGDSDEDKSEEDKEE